MCDGCFQDVLTNMKHADKKVQISTKFQGNILRYSCNYLEDFQEVILLFRMQTLLSILLHLLITSYFSL